MTEQNVIDRIIAIIADPNVCNGATMTQGVNALTGDFGDYHKKLLRRFCEVFHDIDTNSGNFDWETNGERWLMEEIAKFHPTDVFDVGANVGGWTHSARIAFPNSRLHAFEIVPDTAKILADRFAGVDGIVVNQFGLSDHSGTIPMNVYELSNQLSSHVDYPHGAHRKIDCPVERGDEYMMQTQVDVVGFLKMDVEGAENLVLDGFGVMPKLGSVQVIQFEYARANILTHFLLYDFYRYFNERGFVVGKLMTDHVAFREYDLAQETFYGPNFVAVHKTRPDIISALIKRKRK